VVGQWWADPVVDRGKWFWFTLCEAEAASSRGNAVRLADAVAAVCRRHAHRSVGLQAGLFLLVVGFDEPVDQVVDAPGLGEPAFGESVAQFGLGQTLVRFPSLRPVPVNPFPFWLLDIPDRFRSTGGMVDVMFAWSTSFCGPSFQAPATRNGEFLTAST
jgi:hypothetical protein